MFERFTDRARRVVVLAQEEARLLNHAYIGTEHLLLGLINEPDQLAGQALSSLGISFEKVRAGILEILGEGAATPTGHIPFTPRAKKVLELSLREAVQMEHPFIGTEHLLLGLIREGEGVAAQVLNKLGADLERVRHEVVQLLAGMSTERPQSLRGPAVEGLADRLLHECGASLLEWIRFRVIEVQEHEGEAKRRVTIVFCRNCGRTVQGIISEADDPGANPEATSSGA